MAFGTSLGLPASWSTESGEDMIGALRSEHGSTAPLWTETQGTADRVCADPVVEADSHNQQP